MTQKTSVIVMRMGYAESSFASLMIIKSGLIFDTAIEAVNNLAHCLLLKFAGERELEESRCCATFRLRAMEGDKRCPSCGKLISPAIGMIDFSDFVWSQAFREMGNGYGESLGEFGPWDEFSLLSDIISTPADQILDIDSYAERVVPMALTGAEFDDPECPYNYLAAALCSSVERYRRERGHGYLGQDDGLPELFFEKYRLPPRGG
jgi:hypothetical protein